MSSAFKKFTHREEIKVKSRQNASGGFQSFFMFHHPSSETERDSLGIDAVEHIHLDKAAHRNANAVAHLLELLSLLLVNSDGCS